MFTYMRGGAGWLAGAVLLCCMGPGRAIWGTLYAASSAEALGRDRCSGTERETNINSHKGVCHLFTPVKIFALYLMIQGNRCY